MQKMNEFFSIVRKKKAGFQSRLDPEQTLASIVTVKLAMESESVETFNIPQEVLTAAKSATSKYKLSHLKKISFLNIFVCERYFIGTLKVVIYHYWLL